LIPAWQEGISLVKQGSRIMLFCAPELGYGERGSPLRIPGNASLVFEIELLNVRDTSPQR
jgi:FKBP-type peptidyl-prolyl cis-trans isomerase FkpA